MAEQAQKHLAFMKETKETIASFKETKEEVICVGAAYTYAKYKLSDILAGYMLRHPEVQFDVKSDQSHLLFRKMLEQSVDVAFIRGDYEGAINKIPVGRTEAYLVTKEPVELSDLPKMQRIDYRTNDKTKELLDQWWERTFSKPVISGMEVGYIDFSWQLIKRGLGYTICFLPDNFVNEYDLCVEPLVNPDGSRVVRTDWFLYPKEKRISPVLENFIDYIEREIKL